MPLFQGIYYQLSGSAAHPALFFIHGFMGNSGDWSKIVSGLQKNYYCISIDLPGHGFSTESPVRGFKHISNKIERLLNYLDIPHIMLVGYSLGGRIAMYYAINKPERIKKLILESASPGLESSKERKERLKEDKALAQKLVNIPYSEFLKQWYQLPVFNGLVNHPGYNDLIANRKRNKPALLAKALLEFSISKQPYQLSKLSLLNIPIALFCGAKDSKYFDLYTSIFKTLPGSSLYIIPDCSHNSHFENPNLFAVHLAEFLSL